MKPRIEPAKYANSGIARAMGALGAEVAKSTLEPALIELVKIRASQMNGCAYCIDMHTKDARAADESEQRIYALSAWREAPFFNERERAALEWAEALTRIHEGHVSDEVYERVRPHFSEAELVALSAAVVAINGWNRFAVAFRAPVGTYQPAAHAGVRGEGLGVRG